VVAEGVEDEATLHRLEKLGCDFAQGYHFSKPLAPAAFDAWIDIPAESPAPVIRTSSGLSEQPAAA
jgi:EAL domain-containing protein (putative c-di-GMP-specific phosphodiesterase class I)